METIFICSFAFITVIPFLYFVIYVIKKLKYNISIKKMIRENCTPRRAYIKDFLILCYGINQYKVFPIVEDRLLNKFYITYGECDFSYYATSEISYPSYYDYDVFLGGKKLKINDVVNIYICKELERVKMENGFIDINNIHCEYIGTKKETFKQIRINNIVNEGENNFFDDVKELILYEGFIERVNYD